MFGIICLLTIQFTINAQNYLTPEMLIELNRVSAIGISDDGNNVIYRVSKVDIQENISSSKIYAIPLTGGESKEIKDYSDFIVNNSRISSDGQYKLVTEKVKLTNVLGTDFYPELTKSNVYIYDQLNYRHWDKWEDGSYNHVFIEETASKERTDIMDGEPFACPQEPFGGDEDFIWSPDGKKVLYVTKKKVGTEYAVSTNTDIYEYNLETRAITNLTFVVCG